MIVVDLILVAAAALLLVPALVYFIECMVAVFRGLPPEMSPNDDRPLTAVVVPAHNEEGVVGATVRHIRKQLADGEQLIVIADNCCDRTADEASEAGADVWVRDDPEHVGKGYAISYAVNRLAASAPEVVVFIDADCRITNGTIDTLSRVAMAKQRPIQSQYLFVSPPDGGHMSSVSALACLVRNLVRPLGLHHLGFPCHLTGSGMAFPWTQIRLAPAQHGSIVEDLTLGLDMAIAGNEPMLCSAAGVASDLPSTPRAAKVQRRRWEHGQIATFMAYAPRLVSLGLRSKRPALIALAADLSVPPLALLVLLIGLVVLLSAITFLVGGNGVALTIAALALVLVGVATMSAWASFGRQTISIVKLLLVPFYVLWKLPLYLALLFQNPQREWVRTARSSAKSEL
ncbi:MAG: glycosyltransferase family 2 protein [Woeseia sp.]